MRGFWRFGIAWTAFSVLTTAAVAQGTVYVATGSNGVAGNLYTVDITTGAQNLIGPIVNSNGGGAIGITGLAFNPMTDTLYGVTVNRTTGGGNTVAHSLVAIDPNTGIATVIGAFGSPISDISFRSDGVLYGFQTNSFDAVTISLTTGAITPVGNSTLAAKYGGGLAFGPDGTLYVSASGAGDDPTLGGHPGILDRLNPITGALIAPRMPTLTGAPFSWGLNALAFDANGVLYGADTDANSPAGVRLVTINLATGAISDRFGLPNNTDAIAFRFVPVPEPSTIGCFALGIASLIAVFIYRRRA